jgi:DNA helicase HerA-like ATPase
MMNLEDTEGEDRSKFRLIGRSVLSYRFIVPHDEAIFVGEILKIDDQKKGYTFFAKVSDLIHESNFTDERWDTRPFSERFYRLGDDVFVGVDAIPLGYVDETGKFRKPRTLPTKFSRVEVPDARDLSFLTQVMGDVEVGMMKSGQEVIREVPVKIHSEVLPQHMGVFATTGMGKSNFMKVFCASCMREQQFGLLVVDPHGEYLQGGRSSTGAPTLGLVHYHGGRDGLAVFSSRSDDHRRKYGLNALSLEYDDFRIADLSILYDLSLPQRDIVDALADYSGSEVIGFFDRLDPESFTAESHRTMGTGDREIAYRLRTSNPGPLRVIKRRLENLVKGNRRFFRERGSSLPEILDNLHHNRVVLVDIPGMSERSELFVLSIITRVILDKHRETSEKFGMLEDNEEELSRVLITIEEAQRVLGTGSFSTQVFRECAMEGRKFGVGLCVVTQQPKNIDAKVLAQINTFVIMGLGDRGDREMIAGSAKQDLSRMDTEIQTLEQGEAIISSLRIPFPVSTRIHLFEDYLPVLEGKQNKNIRDGLKTGF